MSDCNRSSSFRSTAESVDRRYAFYWRCWPARSSGRQGLHPANDGGDDVRLAARKTAEAPRRGGGLSGPRRWFDVWAQHVEGNFINHRRAEEDKLRAQANG